jgi:hypothetical protein
MKLQNKTTTRLGGYLTAAVTCSTIASTASAAIVTFANSGSFIEGTVDNGDQPTITIALPGGENLFIDPFNSPSFLDLTFDTSFTVTNGRFTGSGLSIASSLYPGLDLLSYGDSIFANNSGYYPAKGSVVSQGTPQSDFVGDVSGFIGFITPLGNKGWMDVAYNSTTGLFQYNGGAVATAGENLRAGVVPEPSTAVLSLGALAAGAFIRRRKQAA